MTVATMEDFNRALEQAAKERRMTAAQRKREILADSSRHGRLRSGATFFEQTRALDDLSLEYVSQVRSMICDWAGVYGLDLQNLRNTAVQHLRAFVSSFVVPEFVSAGQYKPDGSSLAAVEGQLADTAQKVEARIKEIEFGVGFGTPSDFPSGAVFNIIHAQSVTGGIQQGTQNSQQTNAITLTTTEIEAAIERLETVLAATGHVEILTQVKPDLSTMKAQLGKQEPSTSILREAGKSVRTTLEGAIGGAIGNAVSPAVAHALITFAVALGLS